MSGIDRLEVQAVARPDRTELRLGGDLTLATVSGFEERLRETERERRDVLVLDLRMLRFMDSVALGAIIAADNRSRASGRRLVLITAEGPVHSLLSLTGLDGRLEVVREASREPITASSRRRSTTEDIHAR
jgi:anti-sigma B factor antagonist